MRIPSLPAVLPRTVRAVSIVGILLLNPAAVLAGDPLAVDAVLGGLKGNWPDAQLSVDVTGIKDTAVRVDQPLQIEYEAAGRGYLTWVRVSSHGEISARSVTPAAGATGSLSLEAAPALGHEQLLFLFSDSPLPPELGRTGAPASAEPAALGADREHAQSLLARLQGLQSQGLKLALRRFDYQVEAPGQTQYTTRSVIRTLASEAGKGVTREASRFPARIEFDFDSDRLTVQGQRDLDVFGEVILETLKDHRVTLEGHTDALGSDRYNLRLSERRAAAVERYLMESFGLPRGQLKVRGKGKADPVATNASAWGRSQNRRVDFVFQERGRPAG